MKKLLALIGAFGLVVAGGETLVSCGDLRVGIEEDTDTEVDTEVDTEESDQINVDSGGVNWDYFDINKLDNLKEYNQYEIAKPYNERTAQMKEWLDIDGNEISEVEKDGSNNYLISEIEKSILAYYFIEKEYTNDSFSTNVNRTELLKHTSDVIEAFITDFPTYDWISDEVYEYLDVLVKLMNLEA